MKCAVRSSECGARSASLRDAENGPPTGLALWQIGNSPYLWVKTRRDRGFSFRLDIKVVPEYPVKALCA